MKNSILLTFILIICATTVVISQEIQSDYSGEICIAEQTRNDFIKKDSGLQSFFEDSYGYAILPSIGKGGLIVGGAHGKGVLFENGNPTGKTEMTQITIGGQIGGKSYAEIIFFKSEDEYNVFLTGRFEVSASLSAVALNYGVSNDLDYSDGIAIVTQGNTGLMAEAVVGGQKFAFNPFE